MLGHSEEDLDVKKWLRSAVDMHRDDHEARDMIISFQAVANYPSSDLLPEPRAPEAARVLS